VIQITFVNFDWQGTPFKISRSIMKILFLPRASLRVRPSKKGSNSEAFTSSLVNLKLVYALGKEIRANSLAGDFLAKGNKHRIDPFHSLQTKPAILLPVLDALKFSKRSYFNPS
jgi:hypothetical protein